MTMDTSATTKPAPKARPIRPDCCADEKCTSGSRNNYFPGKRLTPDAFRTEQTYLVERRHLLNRAINGFGVVYGYPVTMAAPDPRCPGAETGTLEIGEGLALDRCGRELVQTGPVALTVGSVVVLDAKGMPVRDTDAKARAARLSSSACWLLKVHYAEQKTGPVTLKDACSCERTEWDQVCETVRYSLQPVDCAECCVEQACELKCGCSSGPCCEERADPVKEKLQQEYEQLLRDFEQQSRGACDQQLKWSREKYDSLLEDLKARGWAPAEPGHPHGRGGCRCLCEHLTGLQIGCECHSLCDVDRCARMDLHNGLALACVKLAVDKCEDWQFASVYDACGPRRLVKRNDLLFDLIRGCDLTRISEISWGPWHRRSPPVPWPDFRAALGQADLTGHPSSLTKFSVSFTGPVLRKTLLPDCFTMTVVAAEFGEGWGNIVRVPIVGLSYIEQAGDPADYVRGATLVVDARWVDDAVGNVRDIGRRKNLFAYEQAQVEIEIRGDFIVDCKGQTVDANASGLSRGPSGNGTRGGTFLSTFTVDARPSDPKPLAAKSAEGVTS
jgi:hypothetical protein